MMSSPHTPRKGLTRLLNVVQAICLLVGGFATLGQAALAQNNLNPYPSRPVKIVVPFATGGPADNYARFVAIKLQESMNNPFVVDNHPGAGSVIGTDLAAKAPADGYTLLLMSNAHTVNETLIANKPYSLTRDFIGVAPINYSDLLLVAHPSTGFQNIAELIKYAKEHPGKLNFASSGPGTPYHMAGELFKSLAHIDLVHVPYKGSSGARTDVIGGQVDMMFDAVTTMTEQVKSGKVRAMATTGLKRSDVLPDVPTMNESGVTGYEATIWVGIMAPKGTPKPIVDKLNAAITAITKNPDVQKTWSQQGAVPLFMNPTVFDQYVRQDVAKWAQVIKQAGIEPN